MVNGQPRLKNTVMCILQAIYFIWQAKGCTKFFSAFKAYFQGNWMIFFLESYKKKKYF